MKTKHLLTIAALLGLNLVPALPSHAQRSNPCKSAPLATPSRETRQIRVEKYGIAFNIPANYRTSSEIKEDYMNIKVYNPSAFDYAKCLRNNNIVGEGIYFSNRISISKTQASISLIDIPTSLGFPSSQIGNISKLTIANQPAISFNYGNDSNQFQAVNFLFLLPSKNYSVLISIPSVLSAYGGNALAETIKSSFTFDLSSSPYSEAVNSDDLISVVQTKTCQLLNQGSSISDVVSNVKPTVKKLDKEYLFIHANLSRKMHSESGNDVDIVTRRMIGGAIKRDCPQFQNKLTEYYKSNFSSNSQPVNSKPEPINSKFVGTFQCSPYDSRDTRPQPPLTKLTDLSLDSRGSDYVLKGIFNDERRNFNISLNSKLHLISKRLIPYTQEPMKISPDGKFTVTILRKSNVCTYSGIAQISPEASTRLFDK